MVVLGGGRCDMSKVPLYRFLMSEVPCTVFLCAVYFYERTGGRLDRRVLGGDKVSLSRRHGVVGGAGVPRS